MKSIDLSLRCLALPLCFTACLEGEEATTAPEPRVFFVSPADGDRVPTELSVVLATRNFMVKPAGASEPGAGYLNIFVDETCATAGTEIEPAPSRLLLRDGALSVDLALDPGPHRLCAQASDGEGRALQLGAAIDVEVQETTVRVLSPLPGSAVPQRFELVLSSQGITIEPAGEARHGAGHYYVAQSGECPAPDTLLSGVPGIVELTGGERVAQLELPLGVRALCAGLADGLGRVLEPRARLEVYVGPY